MTLSDFLAKLGLEQYLEAFLNEGVEDVDTLRALDEVNLEQLGVKLGHRKKLLNALRSEQPPATTAEPLSQPAQQTAGRKLKLFLSYGRDDHATEVRALRDALRAPVAQLLFARPL